MKPFLFFMASIFMLASCEASTFNIDGNALDSEENRTPGNTTTTNNSTNSTVPDQTVPTAIMRAFLDNMPSKWIESKEVYWSFPINPYGGTTDIIPRFALFEPTNNSAGIPLLSFRIATREDGRGAQVHGFAQAVSPTRANFRAVVQESLAFVPDNLVGEIYIDNDALYYYDNYGHTDVHPTTKEKLVTLYRGPEKPMPTPTSFRQTMLDTYWRGRRDTSGYVNILGEFVSQPGPVRVYEEGGVLKLEFKSRPNVVDPYVATFTFKNEGTDRALYDGVLVRTGQADVRQTDKEIVITSTTLYLVDSNTDLLYRGKRIVP